VKMKTFIMVHMFMLHHIGLPSKYASKLCN
jgi:hypothetical protein